MKQIITSVRDLLAVCGFGQGDSRLLEAVLATTLRHIAGQDDAVAGGVAPVVKTAHFAVLTSWRTFARQADEDAGSGDEKSSSRRLRVDTARPQNLRRTNYRALIDLLQSQSLRVVSLTGSWLESVNEPRTDPFERSLFVAGDQQDQKDVLGAALTLDGALSLGLTYHQDSVMYCGPETQGAVILYGRDRTTGTYSVWSTWEHIKIDAARTIAQQLQRQKRKLLGSAIKRWLGCMPDGKPEDAGASHVGDEDRGRMRQRGFPHINPDVSNKACRIAERLIERLLFPCSCPGRGFRTTYESEGISPADLGVRLLDQSSSGRYHGAWNILRTLQAAGLTALIKPIHLDRINEAGAEIAQIVLTTSRP